MASPVRLSIAQIAPSSRTIDVTPEILLAATTRDGTRTSPLRGSIWVIVPSPVFPTQTKWLTTAIVVGNDPVRTRATTRPAVGSTMATAFGGFTAAVDPRVA